MGINSIRGVQLCQPLMYVWAISRFSHDHAYFNSEKADSGKLSYLPKGMKLSNLGPTCLWSLNSCTVRSCWRWASSDRCAVLGDTYCDQGGTFLLRLPSSWISFKEGLMRVSQPLLQKFTLSAACIVWGPHLECLFIDLVVYFCDAGAEPRILHIGQGLCIWDPSSALGLVFLLFIY